MYNLSFDVSAICLPSSKVFPKNDMDFEMRLTLSGRSFKALFFSDIFAIFARIDSNASRDSSSLRPQYARSSTRDPEHFNPAVIILETN